MARRRKLLSRESDTVRALNVLAGFEDSGQWPLVARNLAQASVLRRVHDAHQTGPPWPDHQSGQAALRQLLKKGPGYDSGPGQLASYQRSKLSLPRDQAAPIDIQSILPETELKKLDNFREELLLSPEELAGVVEKGLEGLCYLDPVLAGSTRKYHEFIADLYSCGLLHFTNTPKVQIDAFCVTKKSGKQRLVIDARRANRLFRRPPRTLPGHFKRVGGILFSSVDRCKGSSGYPGFCTTCS